MADLDAPVESLMYLPTTPLELAIPSGKRELFEFNNNRAVSPELAAKMTIFTSDRILTHGTGMYIRNSGGQSRCLVRHDLSCHRKWQ